VRCTPLSLQQQAQARSQSLIVARQAVRVLSWVQQRHTLLPTDGSRVCCVLQAHATRLPLGLLGMGVSCKRCGTKGHQLLRTLIL